jgi:hypothetical protein
MTVPERVAQFLNERRPAAFSDDPVASELNLERRQQAQQATAPLGAGPGYTRVNGRCSVCWETKKVISAN